ncbi:UNVERIFIED_CONTAM: hypothetical protein K2H54_015464 [Gekko kuhli]
MWRNERLLEEECVEKPEAPGGRMCGETRGSWRKNVWRNQRLLEEEYVEKREAPGGRMCGETRGSWRKNVWRNQRLLEEECVEKPEAPGERMCGETRGSWRKNVWRNQRLLEEECVEKPEAPGGRIYGETSGSWRKNVWRNQRLLEEECMEKPEAPGGRMYGETRGSWRKNVWRNQRLLEEECVEKLEAPGGRMYGETRGSWRKNVWRNQRLLEEECMEKPEAPGGRMYGETRGSWRKNVWRNQRLLAEECVEKLEAPGGRMGLYLASIFYKDDNILVTHEDQIPVVEIDDTYSCLLMQDFLWFTKVSCMWDEILWLRQCVTVSQSSCSCILQTRFKMLLAISQMQGLLGIQELGQVFFEPIKDKQGNILVVTLKEVKTSQTFESVRWVPLSKLQTSRRSVSSPEEPTALDTLLMTMQDKLAYHQKSSQALPPGLYLGYLKLCSAVDQIRVLVPERLPNVLCHVKIRNNPNVSREEWEWLQNLASLEEPIPPQQDLETTPQNLLLQELQGAVKELVQLVNIPLHEAKDFRLYSQEVLDFGGQVSFLLLLPPSDDVCTAPGQNNPYTPRSGFFTLPLQIFELVHFFTYDREFITQYCQVSALLELESLLSQQSLREAFSDAELTTAKQRHQQVQDYMQQMEEIWREMRWMMDALQHARYKQPSGGIPLVCFLEESSIALKEKTQSTSSHLDFLPSPTPSPETSRKLNSDSHGISDEEGSSEVFLATDSDYDSSRAQSPRELDLVYSSSGPECCSRRNPRPLRDSAPDVLQSHELKTAPILTEEPRPPPELYDSDFVLPSRQIELLRITEKRQAYCVRTSSLDFPKPLCHGARKSCPGSVDSSPTESRTAGRCSPVRFGTGLAFSPKHSWPSESPEPVFRTRSVEWTRTFQEVPESGHVANRGKLPGSAALCVCPQYETGLSKETNIKDTGAFPLLCPLVAQNRRVKSCVPLTEELMMDIKNYGRPRVTEERKENISLRITNKMTAEEVVKLVVEEMNEVSRNVLGDADAFCYGEEQLGHFGLVFVSEEVEQWLPNDFLPLSLQKAWPDGRFYVRIKETSPLLFQYGPATTV